MNPNHENLIDTTLDGVRDITTTILAQISDKRLPEATIDAVTAYMSVALAESDEPVSVRERIALARHEVVTDLTMPLRSRVKATKVGRSIVCRAFNDAGLIAKNQAARIDVA